MGFTYPFPASVKQRFIDLEFKSLSKRTDVFEDSEDYNNESKQEEMYGLYGLYLMIFGPIAAWVSSLPLFGFGELIERSVDTNEVINNLDEQLYNIANSVRAIERVACEENKD